jgi:hypothetical protein
MPVDTRQQLTCRGPLWCEWCVALSHEAWLPVRLDDGTSVLLRPVTLDEQRTGTVKDVAGARYQIEVHNNGVGAQVLLTPAFGVPAGAVSGPITGYYNVTISQIGAEPPGMFTEIMPRRADSGQPPVYLRVSGYPWWSLTEQYLTDVHGVQHRVIATAYSGGLVTLRFDGTAR